MGGLCIEVNTSGAPLLFNQQICETTGRGLGAIRMDCRPLEWIGGQLEWIWCAQDLICVTTFFRKSHGASASLTNKMAKPASKAGVGGNLASDRRAEHTVRATVGPDLTPRTYISVKSCEKPGFVQKKHGFLQRPNVP